MSEKFALKWNDFQSNWFKSLSELRRETDFADVTLISEDKVKFSAHKILLISCSNTFKVILKENNHSIPLLYLGGISSVNLAFILDYIYYGEVNLLQEQLDTFLQSAEKLEIQGLIGNGHSSGDASDFEQDTDYDSRNIQDVKEDQKYYQPEEKQIMNISSAPVDTIKRQNTRAAKAASNGVARIDVGSMSSKEIELKIKELYEKVDGVWRCLACEYTTNNSSGSIRRHIESHIDGLSYKCTQCNKEFRSSNILTTHKIRSHK